MPAFMDMTDSRKHIGYSVFETFEECYQYNENACFIAATRSAAETFLRNGYTDPQDCRIDSICFGDIMKDFGASCGEYAMEREAFLRFKTVAERNGVEFRAEPYDGDDGLLVVEIEGVTMDD
jgi:hypothetical protein